MAIMICVSLQKLTQEEFKLLGKMPGIGAPDPTKIKLLLAAE